MNIEICKSAAADLGAAILCLERAQASPLASVRTLQLFSAEVSAYRIDLEFALYDRDGECCWCGG
jgi:hypothetical protein